MVGGGGGGEAPQGVGCGGGVRGAGDIQHLEET